MASFAHLSREERIGLGIAAAAHVALVAALVLQVQDDPTALPIPERMSVSLADEVSLESTAPDPSAEPQASIAPVLSPEPEPVVEPVREVVRPTPRPTVAPRPTPRVTQRPTPTPTPRATPTRQAGGTRLGDDFLEGVGGSERTNNPGSSAATAGPQVRASLAQSVLRQVRPHWQGRVPQGVGTEKLVTILSIELNPDGRLAKPPTMIGQEGIDDSNRAQAGRHAEQAIRAVQLAAPFDLPAELYDSWKKLPPLRFRKST